jgi:trimeric autotransporter adhesin
MLRSNLVGTTRTLTVGTLLADYCDFRDITIAGTAAGGSPTNAGDCSGNSGVTFPAPKTVYWNLSGTPGWDADGWATTSGGVPATNNFPLAQDTVVFDDAGSAGTVTMRSFNIGTVDMSARTSAMTLTISSNLPTVYGNWLFGTGVSSTTTTGTITFAGRSTSTITSNGIAFGCNVTIDCGPSTVQLADALELNSARIFKLTSGTFDAVSYNVTAGRVSLTAATGNPAKALKMGSGTWTLTGTGNIWGDGGFNTGGFTLYKGTANILLSDTSGATRLFSGGNLSYNKLTIGGATGTSTLTITNNNSFTELASTKTVAHTIGLGTTVQTFGKWSVTGTAGNVVTLTGTGTAHRLVGACTDGIDYLAMGSIGFATYPAEFYAGANSTGTAAAPVYRTAKPADSVRYWVGGTGNWNDTAHWSTSSGGAGGADLPRSHDDVVFDSNSNATDYTATVNAITSGNRCKALTIAGPASGNVTLAGSTALFVHDDITLPATGLTRTYTGVIWLSGTGAGKTITTNGISLASDLVVNGSGCEWSLGSALTTGAAKNLQVISGKLDTAGYNFSGARIYVGGTIDRELSLGSSTITCLTIGYQVVSPLNFTFDAGTSTIVHTSIATSFSGAGLTYHNLTIDPIPTTHTFSGANTFNNLTVANRTSVGISALAFEDDQTINGTLTLSAGTNATRRTFVRSNTIGTTRTLTCAAVASLTDIDFRDITIAGAAAPVSGTRLGECGGNSGITFDAGVNKYWVSPSNGVWESLRGLHRVAVPQMSTISHWPKTPLFLKQAHRAIMGK